MVGQSFEVGSWRLLERDPAEISFCA
jgi:hypothetical protein